MSKIKSRCNAERKLPTLRWRRAGLKNVGLKPERWLVATRKGWQDVGFKPRKGEKPHLYIDCRSGRPCKVFKGSQVERIPGARLISVDEFELKMTRNRGKI